PDGPPRHTLQPSVTSFHGKGQPLSQVPQSVVAEGEVVLCAPQVQERTDLFLSVIHLAGCVERPVKDADGGGGVEVFARPPQALRRPGLQGWFSTYRNASRATGRIRS